MKFQITMKDPDGVEDAIMEAARDSVANVSMISPDEKEELIEYRTDLIRDSLSKWFEYNEYLTVEIDTDAETCTVKQND